MIQPIEYLVYLRSRSPQKGFTVVEVLIATAVFSLILLVLLAAVMQFSNSYFKASNVAATQATARNIMDVVTQAIQYDPATIGQAGMGTHSVVLGTDDSANYQCMGGYIFVYSMGTKFSGETDWQNEGSDASPGFFAKETYGCPQSFDSIDTNNSFFFYGFTNPRVLQGKQLLGKNMRVSQFSITSPGTTKAYTVNLQIAYGDDDVLCNPGDSGSCNNSSVETDYSKELICRTGEGSRFCAVSKLYSTVQRRLE